MLQSLRIRNLAIVEDLRVEFGDGLNVITKVSAASQSRRSTWSGSSDKNDAVAREVSD
jgi:hypothetical protein